MGDLFMELGEDGRYLGHDFLGVLNPGRRCLDGGDDFLLELVRGFALADHLLEGANELCCNTSELNRRSPEA